MRFHQLSEARKPAAPAAVDLPAVLARLKALAVRLKNQPFDLTWDFQPGNKLKDRVTTAVLQYYKSFEGEDEEPAPVDENELYMEHLPYEWRTLVFGTFSNVAREAAHEIKEYQKRHGERLDQEAGFEHDMHYVEDSDWLRAMAYQRHFSEQVAYSSVGSPQALEALVTLFESFVAEWPDMRMTDQRDEITLTEGMEAGFSSAVPLLLLLFKKIAA